MITLLQIITDRLENVFLTAADLFQLVSLLYAVALMSGTSVHRTTTIILFIIMTSLSLVFLY